MTSATPSADSEFRTLCKGPDARVLLSSLLLQLALSGVVLRFQSIWALLSCAIVSTAGVVSIIGIRSVQHPRVKASRQPLASIELTRTKTGSLEQNVMVKLCQSDEGTVDSAYASRIATPSLDPTREASGFPDHQTSLTASLDADDLKVVEKVLANNMPLHKLEALTAGNFYQAIRIRRALLSSIKDTGDNCGRSLSDSVLPMYHYDYSQVQGRCAENVIGYMPIPVGIAGPLRIDGTSYLVPLATTEGALIASTSRGAKALNAGQGIHTELLDDAMTRAPVLHFPSLQHAAATTKFLASTQGRQILKTAFDSTSAYARLLDVTPKVVGSAVYLRFRATTGDAMGMNMVGKGVSHALATLPRYSTLCPSLAHMQLSSLSSNTCTDKKPAATNWINGRGKSICAEATVPAKAVETVLKASVDALVALNTSKNLVGSALAGMGAGGYNAQAANIVAALSIATGQDAAQVVTSSNCLTHMEKTPDADLKISVTMPSLEVGTIGGGTSLSSQSSMLKLLGCRDADAAYGANASRLGRVIAGAVLAGELSLMSALVSQDLIGSHMQLNRK